MKRFLFLGLLSVLLVFTFAATSSAATMWADHVTQIYRGDTSVGWSTEYYGGTWPSSFPVVLTEAEAISSVLGAPDGDFLTLPGRDDTPSGTGFLYSFVTLGFASNFTASEMVAVELGGDGADAHIWVWTLDGGNVQFDISSGSNDNVVIDLSPYETFMNDHGGAFDRITVGGLDTLGGSPGFDLDAVGVTAPVPEPATMLLFGVGLVGLAGIGRKKLFKKN